MDDIRIIQGDCREVLPTLAAESVDCVVTSPPYFQIKNYGHDAQIGLESGHAEYVASLVGIFSEVRRCLKPKGCVFLNLGDTYNAYNGGRGASTSFSARTDEVRANLPAGYGLTCKDLPNKCLVGIPWRVALAMVDDGWILRSEIIWFKGSATPERVKDRPSRTHETVLLFTRADRYDWHGPKVGTVWEIPCEADGGGHPAAMPLALARRCISLGCPPGGTALDPFAGSGTTIVAAMKAGCGAIGVEPNPRYIRLARRRISASETPLLSVINEERVR